MPLPVVLVVLTEVRLIWPATVPTPVVEAGFRDHVGAVVARHIDIAADVEAAPGATLIRSSVSGKL